MPPEHAIEVEDKGARAPTASVQPPLLDRKPFFSLPYELFVSLRYLRAKRRERFISLITFFSMLGVLLGVMTLNIVLAVMTGFEEDLRNRILGFNPHVVVSSYSNTIADYKPVVEKIKHVPGVITATPVVYGQVMVSSRQRVSGVVVRAVEPQLASSVVNVVAHVVTGTLDDLGRERDVVVPEEGGSRTVRLSWFVIGEELRRQLDLQVGEPVSLVSPLQTTRWPLGMVPKVKRYFVDAAFKSGMIDYDGS